MTDTTPTGPAPLPYAEHERQMLAVIAERDEAQEWADRLAAALAPAEVIGEHSSGNNPWANALALKAAADVNIDIFMAPPIPEDSWLHEDRFAEFRRAYAYAANRTRAIAGLAKLHPEEAYWVYSIIKRGMERQELLLVDSDDREIGPGIDP